MDAHRVRRLAAVLVTSQLRSGRTTSDPRSFLGRPELIGVVDLVLVVAAAGLLAPAVLSSSWPTATFRAPVEALLPFLPLAAAGVVLIAGTMFELTTTAKFAGSDAANWMPIRPSEYVAASASAIAYSYSPAIALLFGGLLPVAYVEGLFPAYLLAAVLSLIALFEGAVLVEMVRAFSSRAGSVGSGRRGAATFVVRAVILILVILLLDLALNPVFLLGAVQRLSSFPVIAAAIPFFWSSRALAAWNAGDPLLAAAFSVGQVGFVALLGWWAALLRVRYWVPAPAEFEVGEHRYASSHPILAGLGLSRPETAIVSKDLKGYVRRRELLPLLVVPIVLVLLLAIEGGSFGLLGTIVWVGWVAGFFGLLLSSTSVGQERRALQLLFAFPISPRSIFRAKATAVLLPVLLGSALTSIAVSVFFHFPATAAFGTVVLTVSVGGILVLWGLVFASRYSDFQDRPRPQFVRPSAMIAASLSGLILLVTIVVPGAYALATPTSGALGFGLAAAGIALVAGTVAYLLARAGFDTLFRELPF